MHRSTTLMCHCEERSDVAISGRQLRFRRWLSCDLVGYCEIATSACGLLAMTNLGAGAVGGVRGNLQLPMALTARKGHAASVRRQSRQRLRSERRYRRNWLGRFNRQPANCECLPEIATAPLGPRNDKLGSLAPLNLYRKQRPPAWRSVSAMGSCRY